MSKRKTYIRGDTINGTVFVTELERRAYVESSSRRNAIFKCKYCGSEFETLIGSVLSGNTNSCGCNRKTMIKKSNTTHGLSSHILYRIYRLIKDRCYNTNNKCFHRYGGRGIIMCDEWLNDFMAFYNFSIDNNWRQYLKIDRIDNNGNYDPLNCRFTTHTVNMRNSSATKLTIEKVSEIKKTLHTNMYTHKEIGVMFGVSRSAITAINSNYTWKDVII